VPRVAEPKNPSQAKAINRCLLAVRGLPLERFRIPSDGRKWRFLARQCAGCLEYLASFANGDGTFTRVNERGEEINYSPSEKRLIKRFAKSSYYRLTNRLHDVALLSWDRRDHYHKRIYRIDVNAPHPFYPEHVPYSPEHVPYSNCQNPKHVPRSHENVKNTSHGEYVLTRPTDSHYPSLDSFPSTSKNIPSKPSAAQPAADAYNKFVESIFKPKPITIDVLSQADKDFLRAASQNPFWLCQAEVERWLLDTFGTKMASELSPDDYRIAITYVANKK
jgi:hypothetical protein